jgi:hypothetical protein
MERRLGIDVSAGEGVAAENAEDVQKPKADAEDHDHVDDRADLGVHREQGVHEVKDDADHHKHDEDADHARSTSAERAVFRSPACRIEVAFVAPLAPGAERPEVTFALKPIDEALRLGMGGIHDSQEARDVVEGIRSDLARHLSNCIILPGFRCASCGGTFTGLEKENLTECRACGAPRRT